MTQMKLYFRAEAQQAGQTTPVVYETDLLVNGADEGKCWTKGAKFGAAWAWDATGADDRFVENILMWRSGD